MEMKFQHVNILCRITNAESYYKRKKKKQSRDKVNLKDNPPFSIFINKEDAKPKCSCMKHGPKQEARNNCSFPYPAAGHVLDPRAAQISPCAYAALLVQMRGAH